jgi:hypothetical protein
MTGSAAVEIHRVPELARAGEEHARGELEIPLPDGARGAGEPPFATGRAVLQAATVGGCGDRVSAATAPRAPAIAA